MPYKGSFLEISICWKTYCTWKFLRLCIANLFIEMDFQMFLARNNCRDHQKHRKNFRAISKVHQKSFFWTSILLCVQGLQLIGNFQNFTVLDTRTSQWKRIAFYQIRCRMSNISSQENKKAFRPFYHKKYFW